MAVDLNIQPYRFANPLKRTQETYDALSGFEQDAAAHRAGNALKAGNVRGAADEFYGAGMIDQATGVERNAAAQQDAQTKQEQERAQSGAKALTEAAARLRQIHDADPNAPPEVRRAKVLQGWDYLTPRLRALGESPEEIAAARQQLETDPDTALTLLGSEAAKAAGYELRSVGDEVIAIDPRTAKEIARFKSSKPIQLDPEKPIYAPDTPAAGAPAPPAPAPAGTQADPDVVWKSIVTQESGGDRTPGDAVGPNTKYGNALGSTQMLPATAEAMACKLGIRWDPRLMRENTP